MNGKHPIDDLFARGLRDAEATPPPAVWQGIVRERGKARPAPAEPPAPAKTRRRWGLAAILLLLLGAAGYWLVAQENPAQNVQASTQTSPGGEGRSATDHAGPESGSPNPDSRSTKDQSATTPNPAQTEAATSSAKPTAAAAEKQAHTPGASPAQTENKHTSEKPTEKGATRSKKREAHNAALATTSGNNRRTGGATEDGGNTDEPMSGEVSTSPAAGDAALDPSSGKAAMTKKGRTGGSDLEGSGPPEKMASSTSLRTSPDVHLPTLDVTITPYMNSAALPLGPFLRGDSTAPYVLNKGQLWFAAQAEWAALNGEWKGGGAQAQQLNTSETWRKGNGLGIAFGYEWQSGWAIGLGIGVNRQRSRFLRRETQAAHSEVVIDTTWTASPLGDPTNYTWDIIQTVVQEPVVERDLSATNTYMYLRIAPEVGYRFAQMKRFGLSARLAPVIMVNTSRKGNSVTTTVRTDSTDTAPATTVLPLEDGSLDDRFPLTMAVSAGLELRYRLLDRWSVSALPTFTYWMPRTGSDKPMLSMTELGGALRLRYDLRHKERRVK